MKENNTNGGAGGGIGFCDLLTVAFIVLKLTKVIEWSWFWVLSPIIFSTVLVLIFIVIIIFLKLLLR